MNLNGLPLLKITAQLLVYLFISSAHAQSACEQNHINMNYSCKGSIKVNSIEELESYRQTLGLNAKKTHIKNLIINSNLNLESLNLATPCKVTIVENNSLNVAGDICLNAKNGIHIKNGFNLRAKNVFLTSENKVVIRDHANIEVDDLSLISTGNSDSARVHIRHTSSVKTKNLTLSALKKATLGHTSNYQVLEKLTVESNGEDLEEKQWSSIWKNTEVVADSVFFESRAKLKIAKGVKLIANSVTLTGAECKISKRSVIESPFKDGNCLLTAPPDNYPPSASFTISNSPYETGKTIFFDAGNSSDDKKVVRYVWKFDQGITKTTYAPQTSFTYQEGGDKKIVLTVFDAEGLKSVSSQTIFVNSNETPSKSSLSSYFIFEIDDGITELTFTPKFGETPIESAVYKVQETGQSISLLDFHYGNKSSFELLDGIYNIELTIKDKLGFESKFSHLVKVGEDNPPFVKFDVSQSSVTSAFLNLTDSFVHTDEISKVEVNWGDGQIEILDEDTFYKTHEYQDFGSYNITVKIYDEDDLESSFSKTLEMKSEFSDLLSPYALFEAKVEDFAGHVRFYVEKSASPNGQIISYEWNLGDGNVSYEKDPVHFYEAGIYFPKLTVTDSLGQKSSQTQRVVIENDGAPLLAGFECWGEGDYRGCWVAGVHKYSQIEKLKIDWGDGSVEEFPAENGKFTEVEQNHFYQSEGEYTAKFSVHTFDGQSDEKQETFLIKNIGNDIYAWISCFNVVDNLIECDFSNSFSSNGTIVKYKVSTSEGDSYETTSSFLSFRTSSSGNKVVNLEVEDSNGNSAFSSVEVFVDEYDLGLTASIVCKKTEIWLEVECDISGSKYPGGEITNYSIYFDNQDTITKTESSSVLYRFSATGSYLITLVVESSDGQMKEASQIISVGEDSAEPDIRFDYKYIGNRYIELSFKDVSFSQDTFIIEDSDGNELARNKNHQFIFKIPENFSYDLNVKMVLDNQRVVSKQFLLNDNLNFNLNLIKEGDTFRSNLTEYFESIDGLKIKWFVNDQFVSDELSYQFNNQITNVKKNVVKLVVEDDFGARFSKSLEYVIENVYITNRNLRTFEVFNIVSRDGVVWSENTKILIGEKEIPSFQVNDGQLMGIIPDFIKDGPATMKVDDNNNIVEIDIEVSRDSINNNFPFYLTFVESYFLNFINLVEDGVLKRIPLDRKNDLIVALNSIQGDLYNLSNDESEFLVNYFNSNFYKISRDSIVQKALESIKIVSKNLLNFVMPSANASVYSDAYVCLQNFQISDEFRINDIGNVILGNSMDRELYQTTDKVKNIIGLLNMVKIYTQFRDCEELFDNFRVPFDYTIESNLYNFSKESNNYNFSTESDLKIHPAEALDGRIYLGFNGKYTSGNMYLDYVKSFSFNSINGTYFEYPNLNDIFSSSNFYFKDNLKLLDTSLPEVTGRMKNNIDGFSVFFTSTDLLKDSSFTYRMYFYDYDLEYLGIVSSDSGQQVDMSKNHFDQSLNLVFDESRSSIFSESVANVVQEQHLNIYNSIIISNFDTNLNYHAFSSQNSVFFTNESIIPEFEFETSLERSALYIFDEKKFVGTFSNHSAEHYKMPGFLMKNSMYISDTRTDYNPDEYYENNEVHESPALLLTNSLVLYPHVFGGPVTDTINSVVVGGAFFDSYLTNSVTFPNVFMHKSRVFDTCLGCGSNDVMDSIYIKNSNIYGDKSRTSLRSASIVNSNIKDSSLSSGRRIYIYNSGITETKISVSKYSYANNLELKPIIINNTSIGKSKIVIEGNAEFYDSLIGKSFFNLKYDNLFYNTEFYPITNGDFVDPVHYRIIANFQNVNSYNVDSWQRILSPSSAGKLVLSISDSTTNGLYLDNYVDNSNINVVIRNSDLEHTSGRSYAEYGEIFNVSINNSKFSQVTILGGKLKNSLHNVNSFSSTFKDVVAFNSNIIDSILHSLKIINSDIVKSTIWNNSERGILNPVTNCSIRNSGFDLSASNNVNLDSSFIFNLSMWENFNVRIQKSLISDSSFYNVRNFTTRESSMSHSSVTLLDDFSLENSQLENSSFDNTILFTSINSTLKKGRYGCSSCPGERVGKFTINDSTLLFDITYLPTSSDSTLSISNDPEMYNVRLSGNGKFEISGDLKIYNSIFESSENIFVAKDSAQIYNSNIKNSVIRGNSVLYLATDIRNSNISGNSQVSNSKIHNSTMVDNSYILNSTVYNSHLSDESFISSSTINADTSYLSGDAIVSLANISTLKSLNLLGNSIVTNSLWGDGTEEVTLYGNAVSESLRLENGAIFSGKDVYLQNSNIKSSGSILTAATVSDSTLNGNYQISGTPTIFHSSLDGNSRVSGTSKLSGVTMNNNASITSSAQVANSIVLEKGLIGGSAKVNNSQIFGSASLGGTLHFSSSKAYGDASLYSGMKDKVECDGYRDTFSDDPCFYSGNTSVANLNMNISKIDSYRDENIDPGLLDENDEFSDNDRGIASELVNESSPEEVVNCTNLSGADKENCQERKRSLSATCSSKVNGSIINVENQVLGEEVIVADVPFRLTYFSDNLLEYNTRQVMIKLLDSDISNVESIGVKISIANKIYNYNFLPKENLIFNYEWDGKDENGNYSDSKQVLVANIVYHYNGEQSPVTKEYTYMVGNDSFAKLGLSNWALSNVLKINLDLGTLKTAYGDILYISKIISDKGNIVAFDSSEKNAYVFNSNRQHIRTIDVSTGKNIFRFTYKNNGDVFEVYDRNDLRTVFKYDSDDRLRIVSPFGVETFIEKYNSKIVKVSGPSGLFYQMDYYDDSNLLKSFKESSQGKATFLYNELGRLISDKSEDGSYLSIFKNIRAEGYEVSVDKSGLYANFYAQDFDNEENQIKVHTMPNGIKSKTLIKKNSDTLINNGDGAKVEQSRHVSIEDNRKTIVSNRIMTLPSLKSLHSISTEEYVYQDINDPYSLLSSEFRRKINDKEYYSVYNHENRHSQDIYPNGVIIEKYYDGNGNIVSLLAPDQEVVLFEYNSLGMLVKVTQGDRVIKNVFNGRGQVVLSIDSLGNETQYNYDLLGNVIYQKKNDVVTRFSYSSSGSLLSITTPNDEKFDFVYNLSSLISDYVQPYSDSSIVVNPDNVLNFRTYKYDLANRLTEVQLSKTDFLNYRYDEKNQLKEILSGQYSFGYSYYDLTGNLFSIDHNGSKLLFEYDGHLLTKEKLEGSFVSSIEYRYNEDLALSGYNIGEKAISYTFNTRSELTNANSMEFNYNIINGKLDMIKLDSITSNFVHDNYGELSILDYKNNLESFYKETYFRDSMGRIVKLEVDELQNKNIYEYKYNSNGELIEVIKNSSVVENYSYDKNGNRIDAIITTNDQIVEYRDLKFKYDYNGSVASIEKNGVVDYFDYDVFGNLRKVQKEGVEIEYIIDGKNRRVGKLKNSQVEYRFVYKDQLNPVAKLDEFGNPLELYVYGSKGHVPDYIEKDGVNYFIVTNSIGSVKHVVNALNGDIVQSIDYDSYGKVLKDTNPGFQPFGYAGGIYDADTGLVRFGARDYNPGTGRWMQKDPIGFAGGDTNLYRYVGNDPINFIDSDGKDRELIRIDGFHDAVVVYQPGDTLATVYDLAPPTTGEKLISTIGAPVRGRIRKTTLPLSYIRDNFEILRRQSQGVEADKLVHERAQNLRDKFDNFDRMYHILGFGQGTGFQNCIGASREIYGD